MPLIGFVADLHLGTPPLGVSALANDPEVAAELVADRAIALGCARMVLCGDLVDRPNLEPERVDPLCRFLARLVAAGIAVDYILGQHDGRRHWASAAGIFTDGAVRRLDVDGQAPTDLGDGTTLIGRDYIPPQHLHDALAELPESTILAVHQQWHELIGGNVGDASAFASIVSSQQVVSGDYHDHRAVEVEDRLTLRSCGATHLRGAQESTTHAFWTFRTEDGAWETVPIPSRPVFGVMDLEQAEEDLLHDVDAGIRLAMSARDEPPPPGIATPLALVVPATPDRRMPLQRLLERHFAGRLIVHVRPAPSARRDQSGEVVVPDLGTNDLAEAIRAGTADDPALQRLLMAMLASPDRAAALDLARADFFEQQGGPT